LYRKNESHVVLDLEWRGEKTVTLANVRAALGKLRRLRAASSRTRSFGRAGSKGWVGPAEVGERLSVSRATVYALVKSGALGHRRVGLQIRIPLSAVEAFLSQP
jgi:excisionase family DNA binding protein